jgi:hypothetical protein
LARTTHPRGLLNAGRYLGGDEFWVNEEYQKLANLGASLQQFAEITHNEISERFRMQDITIQHEIGSMKMKMEEEMQWWSDKNMEEIPPGMQATDWAAAGKAAQRCLADAAAAAAAHIAEKANEERLAAEHRHAQASLALQQQWEGVQKIIEKEKEVLANMSGRIFEGIRNQIVSEINGGWEGQKTKLFEELREAMLEKYHEKWWALEQSAGNARDKIKIANERIRALEARVTPPRARGSPDAQPARGIPRSEASPSQAPLNNPSREVKEMEMNMAKIGEQNALLLRLIADMNGHMQGLALGVGEVRGVQQQTNKEWGERLEKIMQRPHPEMPLSKPLSEPLSMAQGSSSMGTGPVGGDRMPRPRHRASRCTPP